MSFSLLKLCFCFVLVALIFFLSIFKFILPYKSPKVTHNQLLCTAEKEAIRVEDYIENYWNEINKCQLHHFTARDVVSCLEYLHDGGSWLHFAFIGDSRIRQQFFNFIKVKIYMIIYTHKV
jgi:hypothetical protein